MEKEIEIVKNELETINLKLDKLIQIITEMSLKTKKMDDHINFVEETYTTLRSPLNFICNRFNNLATILPSIKNK